MRMIVVNGKIVSWSILLAVVWVRMNGSGKRTYRPGVGKLFTRKARFGKAVEATGR